MICPKCGTGFMGNTHACGVTTMATVGSEVPELASLRAQLQQSQAECGALCELIRKAEWVVSDGCCDEPWKYCPWCGGLELDSKWAPGGHEVSCPIPKALSGSAGKELLERVEKLEGEAKASKKIEDVILNFGSISPEIREEFYQALKAIKSRRGAATRIIPAPPEPEAEGD